MRLAYRMTMNTISDRDQASSITHLLYSKLITASLFSSLHLTTLFIAASLCSNPVSEVEGRRYGQDNHISCINPISGACYDHLTTSLEQNA